MSAVWVERKLKHMQWRSILKSVISRVSIVLVLCVKWHSRRGGTSEYIWRKTITFQILKRSILILFKWNKLYTKELSHPFTVKIYPCTELQNVSHLGTWCLPSSPGFATWQKKINFAQQLNFFFTGKSFFKVNFAGPLWVFFAPFVAHNFHTKIL